MNLFDKINRNIDYTNLYTLRRPISILDNEFRLATKNKNIKWARDIVITAQKIYSNIITNDEYTDKLWISRMEKFINYLQNQIKINFEA